jgi:Flp pilus assembly pilin Flp
VSDPSPAMAAQPDWQHWGVTVTEPWVAPAAEPGVYWRSEGLVAVLVVAYSVVLGGAVGLIWPRVAPHVRLVAAIDGSEAATKALLGDDMWLALLGIIAGVVSVALLAVVARDAGAGPGGALGLAAGGLLGSLVAAQVGHLVQQPHIVSSLHASFPGITPHSVKTIVGYFGFKVRARAVVVAWPLAAVSVHAAAAALRYRRLAARP